MGNKIFISAVCSTLEIFSWQSQHEVCTTLGLVAACVAIASLVVDSTLIQKFAMRCTGFDLPDSRGREH